MIDPPFHFGHDYGWENRRIIEAANEMGWDQKTLNDYVNARGDSFISLQNASENLSHKDELPGRGQLQNILNSMRDFQNKGK